MKLANRRYTGAKTKLLERIDRTLLSVFDYTKYQNLCFFDVFAGTGVVSEYFIQKPQFGHFILNDFLYSNFVIYQAFFPQEMFDWQKIERIQCAFRGIEARDLESNYYSKHFGGKFFSENDSKLMGFIRDELDKLLESRAICRQEFAILLASLLYSVDRIANTVGHYDAYRKNSTLEDRFIFELIEPIKSNAKLEIYKKDSNILSQELAKHRQHIDVAFIDPPYNSRQYSRFYHLLETLTKNDKPQLYGIALKPKPENISNYCKIQAKQSFKDLVGNLAKVSRVLVVTYNNTYNSKSGSSKNKITLEQIKNILETIGKIHIAEIDYRAFSSGKTDFDGHKEFIFVGIVR
ncbi:MAG: DNA adenine methylase [Helicobacter sp.]|nr:DNA methyltransferase [Helicobacter sp.]MDE7196635.1 DNA adenine methylase [Helicobacter sp.]